MRLISKDPPLPLVKIIAVEGDVFNIIDGAKTHKRIYKKDILKLENEYENMVWVDLIKIELEILFLRECLGNPEGYGFTKEGKIAKISGVLTNQAVFSDQPLDTQICLHTLIDQLSPTRIQQIEDKLTTLEEEHEFVGEAITYLLEGN